MLQLNNNNTFNKKSLGYPKFFCSVNCIVNSLSVYVAKTYVFWDVILSFLHVNWTTHNNNAVLFFANIAMVAFCRILAINTTIAFGCIITNYLSKIDYNLELYEFYNLLISRIHIPYMFLLGSKKQLDKNLFFTLFNKVSIFRLIIPA